MIDTASCIPIRGIVQRRDDGDVVVRIPSENGKPWVEVPISQVDGALWTGDWVEADVNPKGEAVIQRVNSDRMESLAHRQPPREQRAFWERVSLSRKVSIAEAGSNATAWALELAAPLSLGCCGLVSGPHGSGMTNLLRELAQAGGLHSELEVIILLIGAREEEATDWRRRFQQAKVFVAPSIQQGGTVIDTVEAANLVRAAVQRQSELGKEVLFLVDSISELWMAMLACEGFDDQETADRSDARLRIREWLDCAGDFSGEGPLGIRGAGGSITLVASARHDAIDTEIEEDRELHPGLRLMEHTVSRCDWKVMLAGERARQRQYPAIDFENSIALHDGCPVGVTRELWQTARSALAARSAVEVSGLVENALVQGVSFAEFIREMAAESRSAPTASMEDLRRLLGG